MTALMADVRNGGLVVAEPVDLPEGAEPRVVDNVAPGSMSHDEEAALGRALERSLAQADAGELVDADTILAELVGS